MVKKRGYTNRDRMKITKDNESFPGVPPHFWGVMSDDNELPNFTPDYAEAFILELMPVLLPAVEAGRRSLLRLRLLRALQQRQPPPSLPVPSTPLHQSAAWTKQ